MALSIVSAAELSIAGSPLRAEGWTEMIANQSQEPNLLFQQRGAVGSAGAEGAGGETVTVAWTAADQVRVVVRLDPADPAAVLERTWPVPEPAARSLAQRLAGLAPRRGSGDAFSLEMRQPDGATLRMVWGPQEEADWQARIRAEIAAMAHLPYTRALAAQAYGRALADRGAARQAAEVLRHGVQVLGNRYTTAVIADDTATKLALANDNMAAGDFARAVVLYDRVLEARTTLYRESFKPQG